MKASPIRRVAIYMALMIPVGILVSLMNEWMALSYGVSFLTLAAVGTFFSMVALHGSPHGWLRRHARGRHGRHA
jgi:hypothetical protein